MGICCESVSTVTFHAPLSNIAIHFHPRASDRNKLSSFDLKRGGGGETGVRHGKLSPLFARREWGTTDASIQIVELESTQNDNPDICPSNSAASPTIEHSFSSFRRKSIATLFLKCQQRPPVEPTRIDVTMTDGCDPMATIAGFLRQKNICNAGNCWPRAAAKKLEDANKHSKPWIFVIKSVDDGIGNHQS